MQERDTNIMSMIILPVTNVLENMFTFKITHHVCIYLDYFSLIAGFYSKCNHIDLQYSVLCYFIVISSSLAGQ